MVRARRPRDHLLALHARRTSPTSSASPSAAITAIPNGIDPTDLQPVADLPRLRARFAAPDEKLVLLVGRLVYEKGFHLALDALPRLIERRRQRALPRRRLGHRRGRAQGAGRAARPDGARHVHRLDRRRHAALALPDRRPVPGAVDLRAVRARRAGGDGLRLPVHRRRHRRPARGRARAAGASACASAPRDSRVAGADGRAAADRRRAARPARRRGARARAARSTGPTSRARRRPSTTSWRGRGCSARRR